MSGLKKIKVLLIDAVFQKSCVILCSNLVVPNLFISDAINLLRIGIFGRFKGLN
jgi:hypothetical protein